MQRLLEESDYVLVGLGAGGSCTSAAVRDAVTASKASKPAVLFVHTPFERAARAQAHAHGFAELRIYVYPQFKMGDVSEAEEIAKASKAATEFPDLLLTRE
jgi:hypothetical protein